MLTGLKFSVRTSCHSAHTHSSDSYCASDKSSYDKSDHTDPSLSGISMPENISAIQDQVIEIMNSISPKAKATGMQNAGFSNLTLPLWR